MAVRLKTARNGALAMSEQQSVEAKNAAPARMNPIWGYLAAAVGSALFASKAIFIKIAYRHGVDAETLLALRMLIAAPIYAIAAWWAIRRMVGKQPLRAWGMAAFIGILGYFLASILDFWGLEFISANLERVILLTYPMAVIFLGALFFRTPIRGYALFSALLSYVGILILLLFGAEAHAGGSNVLIGAALVFAAGITYAFYQLLAKDSIQTFGGTLFTAVSMLAATVPILALFFMKHPVSSLVVSAEAFWPAFWLATLSTALPSFLISAGIKLSGSQATAIIGTLSPLITIALGVSILGEHFGLTEALGSALVVSAVAIFTITDMREQKRQCQLLER